jgi:hypothetical protein
MGTMFDRVMAAIVGIGICVTAVFLLLNRRTGPGRGADIAMTKPVLELTAETGLTGLYFLDTQGIGGLPARTRRMVMPAFAKSST